MARPPKEGLDYFSLDCVLDDKIKLIEAEYGLDGFGVVVKLFQKIYGQCGYYVEWTNEVALLFAKDLGLGGSVVSEILRASISRGIFSKTVFEKYGVLTSSGIQKRYLDAVKRRKTVTLKRQYLLVHVADIYEDVNINVVYADINSVNVDTNPQRKGKKSREEKSSILEKTALGEFGRVRMLESEYQKLTAKYPPSLVADKIAYLDSNIQSGVKKYTGYKDHYATIGNWCRMDVAKIPKENEWEALE